MNEWDFTLHDMMGKGNHIMTSFRLPCKLKGKMANLRGGSLFRLMDDGKFAEGWAFTGNQAALDRFFSA